MAVHVRCPKCGAKQVVGKSKLDKTVLCRKCRKAYLVGVDTIFDSDDEPDPVDESVPAGNSPQIIYVNSPPVHKSSGCMVVFAWIVAIYFCVNAVYCFVLSEGVNQDYVIGAIFSGILALLFGGIAYSISK